MGEGERVLLALVPPSAEHRRMLEALAGLKNKRERNGDVNWRAGA